MGLGFYEEGVEVKRAVEVINSLVRRGCLVRLIDKSNPDFSIKLDREFTIAVADFITLNPGVDREKI